MTDSSTGPFNVYASIFVPRWLRDINDLPPQGPQGSRLSTDEFVIDYKKYASTFAGSLFLSNQIGDHGPRHSSAVFKRKGTEVAALYKKALEDMLRDEFDALRSKQKEFDLYKIPIEVQIGKDAMSATIHVPGLAEGTPLIRLGDRVSLRQLCLNPAGLPLTYEQSFANGQNYFYNFPVPGWKGFEICATVIAIRKGPELIDLQFRGQIDPPPKGSAFPIFNVLFPARDDWPGALFKALHNIGNILEAPQMSSPINGKSRSLSATAVADQLLFQPESFPSLSDSLKPNSKSKKPRPVEALPKHNHSSSKLEPEQTYLLSERLQQKTGISRSWMEKSLFPIPFDGAVQRTLNPGKFDMNLQDKLLNHEQLKAVDSIRRRDYGDVPFLISGPPGTGKTKTLVETAMQLITKRTSTSHILISAPSDPASDTLVHRLKKYLAPSELFRLNSPSRTFAEVPQELLPYCYSYKNQFDLPSFDKLMSFKIIVLTCRDADMLVQAGVTNSNLYNIEHMLLSTLHPQLEIASPQSLHWGALMIDEAGQAIEPEALIPLSVIAPPPGASNVQNPQFIMAGDHKQLGPRTASKSKEIEMSLFERLLEHPLYRDHPLARQRVGRKTSPLVLTKEMLPMIRPPFSNLIRNYRSHPAILAIPNALFYHDTLLTEAVDPDSMLSWDGWSGRNWPVLFSCNAHNDEIEEDGGGWYNVGEVEKARRFALHLVSSGLIQHEDICVMAPFQAEVKHLRKAFRSCGLGRINIGPVEAFQGLESRFVILCTTRSRDRFLEQDKARGKGIIDEPKRFNVALTRAKQGLIVIGNPQLLTKDPHWSAFLAFCKRNGLWENTEKMPIDATNPTHDWWKFWHAKELDTRDVQNMPALERALRYREDTKHGNQFGAVAMYDDEMWVRELMDALPEDGDYEEDEEDED